MEREQTTGLDYVAGELGTATKIVLPVVGDLTRRVGLEVLKATDAMYRGKRWYQIAHHLFPFNPYGQREKRT